MGSGPESSQGGQVILAIRAALLSSLLCLFLLCARSAPQEVAAPPLRDGDDTRSAFLWSDSPERFPQVVSAEVRVTEQHREEPNPWEVAWFVVGDEECFVGFIPKANGWELNTFNAHAPEGKRQMFLATGEEPKFPVGEPVQVTMIVWEVGVFVVAEDLFVDWRWPARGWRPAWWAEGAGAGIYLEDCGGEVTWR